MRLAERYLKTTENPSCLIQRGGFFVENFLKNASRICHFSLLCRDSMVKKPIDGAAETCETGKPGGVSRQCQI
jgi:hypothetical protein